MNFGFFATTMIPEESLSRKLDNSVKAEEMPYGYNVNPFVHLTQDQHMEKAYTKKEKIIKKGQ